VRLWQVAQPASLPEKDAQGTRRMKDCIHTLGILGGHSVVEKYLRILKEAHSSHEFFIWIRIMSTEGSSLAGLRLAIKRWSVHERASSIASPRIVQGSSIPSTFLADRIWRYSLAPMATQGSRSILFTNTNPQQGFRLLELTPELEKLLTSKDVPT
jgi:hypothetical protein